MRSSAVFQIRFVVVLAALAAACESEGELFVPNPNPSGGGGSGDSCAQPYAALDGGPPESALSATANAALPGLYGHPACRDQFVVAGDMDGDGLDEIASTMSDGCHEGAGPAAIGITYGRAAWMTSVPFVPDVVYELDRAALRSDMLRVAPAGDVDGDGLADLLAAYAPPLPYQPGTPLTPGEQHSAFLLFGASARASGNAPLAGAAVVIEGQPGLSYVGSVLGGIGDVDGDGYDDFAIGSFDGVTMTGSLHLFAGGPNRLTGAVPLDAAAAVLTSSSPATMFAWVEGVGDTNGDGLDDFVATAAPLHAWDARAYLVPGASELLLAPAVIDQLGTRIQGSLAMRQVASADLDGDGRHDLVLGGNGGEGYALRIFLGRDYGPELDTNEADVVISAPGGSDHSTQLELADVRGDERFELVIGTPDWALGSGAAFIWTVETATEEVCLPHVASQHLGLYMHKERPDGGWLAYRETAGSTIAIGDIDGDGRADVLVGAAFAAFLPKVGDDYPVLEAGVAYLLLGAP